MTSDFRQTRRLPSLKLAGPVPMFAQYRQVLALVPVSFSRSVEPKKSRSTLNTSSDRFFPISGIQLVLLAMVVRVNLVSVYSDYGKRIRRGSPIQRAG